MTGDNSDFCTSDDAVSMGVQAATHWDALAHAGYEDLLYNGVPASTIDERGAHELGIQVRSRRYDWILLDVPLALGLDYLEGGHPITGDDLDAGRELAKVEGATGRHRPACAPGTCATSPAGDKLSFTMTSPGPSKQEASSGCAITTSPPSPPTRSCSRCTQRGPRGPGSPCTCCTCATWAWSRARTGRSTPSPPTALPTASTTSC